MPSNHSGAFQHLTPAGAQTLTRAQLLARIAAEHEHWARKPRLSEQDRADQQELSAILHAHLSIGDALQAALDVTAGRQNDYWDSRPAGPDQEAGI